MGLGLVASVFEDSDCIIDYFLFVHMVVEGGLCTFMLGCVSFEFLDVVAGVR